MSIDPRKAARRIIDWNQRAPATAALNVTVTAKLVADAIEVAQALLAVPSPAPAVPSDIREAPVFAFLLGEGPLEGYWFGEHRPSGKRYPANFWWRKYLRAALTSSPPGDGKLREALEAFKRIERAQHSGDEIMVIETAREQIAALSGEGK